MRAIAVCALFVAVATSAACGQPSKTATSPTSSADSATSSASTPQATTPSGAPCVLKPSAINSAFGDALTSRAMPGHVHDSGAACDYEVGFQGTTITVGLTPHPYAEAQNTVSVAGPYDSHAWIIGGSTPQDAYASFERMARGGRADAGLHPEIGAGAFLNSDIDIYVAATNWAWYYVQITNVTGIPANDPYLVALAVQLANADH
jgi:hypothetical protein